MLRAMASMSSLKHIPKALLASIIEISAGDIRSAINCSALVGMQLHQSRYVKPSISMYGTQ